jgi:hypothetical protein
MASQFTKAIYDKLAGITAITDRLSTYEGRPAIFTQKEVPGQAETPWIHTWGHVDIRPFDTKTSNGRTADRDLTVADEDKGSSKAVEEIAELVRDNLHESSLTIPGYEDPWNIEADGPRSFDVDDKNLDIRVVSLNFTAMEV